MKTANTINGGNVPRTHGAPIWGIGRGPLAVSLLALLCPLSCWTTCASPVDDFEYEVNGDAIAITGYRGEGGDVVVPGRIDSIPVTRIDDYAFWDFDDLVSIVVPESVTTIGSGAFAYCASLTRVYFRGAPPSLDLIVLPGRGVLSIAFANIDATVYYMPDVPGWGTTYGGRPTAPWCPQIQSAGMGVEVQFNGFGFEGAWADDTSVVVEACSSLVDPVWTPIATNTVSGGRFHFSDKDWNSLPSRLYRVRSL